MDEKTMYNFLHIPKTAGTTFNYILKKRFGKEYRPFYPLLDNQERQQYLEPIVRSSTALCVASHGRYIPGLDRRYLTFLRNPVRMNVSLYYYVKRCRAWDEWSSAVKRSSFRGFLENLVVHNSQTRWVATVYDNEECGREALEIAKKRLGEMCFVGLVERFDESLLVFFKRLNWEPVHYRRKNIGIYRQEISAEDEEFLKEKNRLDIELYDYARTLFEKEVLEYGDTFREDLERYLKENEEFNDRLSTRFKGILVDSRERLGKMLLLRRK
jgi:hypothetical protein